MLANLIEKIVTPTDAFAITPSDSTALARKARRIWVGATGNIAVITADGTTITYTNIPVGYWNCPLVSQVKSTGTTATGLIGEP